MVGTVGHKVLAGQKKIELDKKTTVGVNVASLYTNGFTR